VAQEYAVLDRAGRLQIPRDFIDTLDMRERVLLALEADHVGVWPDVNGGPAVRHPVHGRHERAGAAPDSSLPDSSLPGSAKSGSAISGRPDPDSTKSDHTVSGTPAPDTATSSGDEQKP
jgi:hypothetical protein